jgi:hypothetical protein
MTTKRTFEDEIFLYPSLWRMIHLYALVLPMTNEAKFQYKKFLESLIILMPDMKSQYSLLFYTKKKPINFSTNETLFRWTYNFHNFVNEVVNKEENKNIINPSYEEVLQRYNNDIKEMQNRSWAHPTWRVIHGLAACYPINATDYDSKAYEEFIYSLQYIIPCHICRHHLKQNLSNLNIKHYLRGRRDAFYFSYNLHELVNRQLNNKGILYDEARNIYKV